MTHVDLASMPRSAERRTRTLSVHSVAAPVLTLGPGPASVIWVQGCGHACPGCMTPGSWSAAAGRATDVTDVAAWVIDSGLPHLTLSGGEPFDQASGLARLIDLVREDLDVTVTTYSGFTLEELHQSDVSSHAELLERTDLLIDGKYVEDLHAALLWRGSSNQRLHSLTGRIAVPADESAGVVAEVDSSGAFTFVGVPAERDFLRRVRRALGDVSDPATRVATPLPFPTKGTSHEPH